MRPLWTDPIGISIVKYVLCMMLVGAIINDTGGRHAGTSASRGGIGIAPSSTASPTSTCS